MSDLTHRLHEACGAVNDVLASSHGLFHDLARHHETKGTVSPPPFWVNQGDLSQVENELTSIAVALKQYGPGPLFNLWCALRAIEALRVTWTGKATE